VFADSHGGALRGDGLYKYHWLPTLRRLGLPPVRLYDARHSAATMLLESGVAMRVVQEVLGHSSRAVTADVYSHVTPAFKRQAARRAGRISGAGSE
jgi:integrase